MPPPRKREVIALADTTDSHRPLRGIDDLLSPFYEAIKGPERFRVGTEAEKHGLLADTLSPVPFVGERSVQRVLELLETRYGWQSDREHPGAPVIALRRGAASITLEPAGQLELSGAPLTTIHETASELADHLRELAAVSSELGLLWLSLGFHPFARHEDLPHVPKLRYGVMERYLPTRGPRALDMMRRTCTVQANFDYSSEHDALRKLRVSLSLQPIVTAMFANSPYYEGKRGPHLCERAAVWLGMDPDRSGLLPFAWKPTAGFVDYVEWALDVPMFLIKRSERILDNTSQTFRQFLAQGAHGERATFADWETHLNSLFPEARLKRTLEMRGADAQSESLSSALPALWKGILYDARALDEAEALSAPFTFAMVEAARNDIAQRALGAQLGELPIRSLAERVLAIASGGLQRIAARREDDRDESVYLEPLQALIQAGEVPAQRLLALTEPAKDWRAAVVAATRVA